MFDGSLVFLRCLPSPPNPTPPNRLFKESAGKNKRGQGTAMAEVVHAEVGRLGSLQEGAMVVPGLREKGRSPRRKSGLLSSRSWGTGFCPWVHWSNRGALGPSLMT